MQMLKPKGIEQIDASCKRLKEEGIAPTIVRYSLAASAMDTTDIVGKELKVSVPCFSCFFHYH